MALIAVTGGIGAGKTTLINQFKSFGAEVADADDIAHSAYLPGNEAYTQILEHWGNDVLEVDGTVNRKKVANIVFTQKEELDWLNGVVHPFVRNEILKKGEKRTLYCAVPLLYETGWTEYFDVVVSAWCPSDVQKERLQGRGWSEEEISRRLSAQVSMDEKLRRADYGIITNCSWACLREQCRLIYMHINSLPL